MPKKRVHEVAKTLELSSKELLERLTELGISAKSHASSLEDDDVNKVVAFFSKNKSKKEVSQDKSHRMPEKEKTEGNRHQETLSYKSDGQQGKVLDKQEKRLTYQNQPAWQNQAQKPKSQEHGTYDRQGQRTGDRQQSEQRTQDRQFQGQRPHTGQNQRPYSGQGQRQSDGQGQRQYDRQGQGQRQYSGQGQGQRQGDWQGQGQRPYSGQGQGQRPYDRQGQGQGQRPYDRQGQGQGQRPYDRQGQGQGQRPYDRQGQGQGQRPYDRQGQGQGQGQRPYDRQGQGQRPYSGQGQRFGDDKGQRPYTGQTQGQGSNSQQSGQRRPSQRPNDRPPQAQRPQFKKDSFASPSFNAKPQAQKPQAQKSYTNRQGQPQKPQGQKFSEQKPAGKQGSRLKTKKGFENFEGADYGNQGASNIDKKRKLPQAHQLVPKEPEIEISLIQLPPLITVKDFAEKILKKPSDIVKLLMKEGVMATINQQIDFETASKIAEQFNILTEEAEEVDILEEAFKEDEDAESDKKERPPVVVVMGHVDHGKTSLLDAIKKSNVIAKEHGGITQHIGAYTVSVSNKPITFLDTPGHEAFTAMRMRGAKVTDIAVLVVAADDGVMPQTIEAINHAKAAEVDIIVAINKIDKQSANPDRVKQELVEYGLVAEDWGGDTICVPVSAMNRVGLDHLLEMIILVSEMKELKANPNKSARGTVIEAQLDKGRGPVATVLVQQGTLKVGDAVVAGGTYGKVRLMIDDKGRKLKKAGPSIPVEIIGLSEVPQAGDMFYVARSDKHARQVSELVVAHGREMLIQDTQKKVSLNDLFEQIQSGSVKELNIVVKADVQGSVEAVKSSLERLSNDEVRIKAIHGGVGAITESDVSLASASNAIIIGFNVRPDAQAKSVADEQKVDIRLYRIIYNAIEDITAAMKGMLDPVFEEKVIGHAEIRQLFKASGVGTIGGSHVTDGKITRNSKVRVVRDGIVVYDGELATLKRFKDDVKEVNSGYECGILLDKFNDIKEGDIVEAYIMAEIPH